jgi:hypothetical protein
VKTLDRLHQRILSRSLLTRSVLEHDPRPATTGDAALLDAALAAQLTDIIEAARAIGTVLHAARNGRAPEAS